MAETEDHVVMLQPDKGQRTLLSLNKVVRLGAPTVCFTPEDVEGLKAQLLDPTQTTQQLLTCLRKLDCLKLEVPDLHTSGIGCAVATLARCSPKLEVSRLARSLGDKWRAEVMASLFKLLPYDAAAAKDACSGEPECPQDEITAEKQQARWEREERRRQRLEADFMASSSEEDEIEPISQEEDPDWAAPHLGVTVQGGSKRTRRSAAGQLLLQVQGQSRGQGVEEVMVIDDEEKAPLPPPVPKSKSIAAFFKPIPRMSPAATTGP